MEIRGGMEFYTFEEVLDELYGPVGTPKRDARDAKVKADIEAEERKLKREQERERKAGQRRIRPRAQECSDLNPVVALG